MGDLESKETNPSTIAAASNPVALTLFSAVIAADGDLVRSVGAFTSQHMETGIYDVFFDGDVSQGTYVATVEATSSSSIPTTIASVESIAMNPTGVRIRTRDLAGTLHDSPFHILVSS